MRWLKLRLALAGKVAYRLLMELRVYVCKLVLGSCKWYCMLLRKS